MVKFDKVIDISRLSSQVRMDIRNIFEWVRNNSQATDNHPLDVANTTLGNTATQQKVEDALLTLNYDYEAFSVKDYIEHVSETLGRSMRLVPFRLSRAMSGACVRRFNVDNIFFSENRHSLLQEHIIIHETAHLLLNHRLRKIRFSVADDKINHYAQQSQVRFRSQFLFRDLKEKLDEIDKQQELEAEIFARMFMTYVKRYKRDRTLKRTQNINLLPPFADE